MRQFVILPLLAATFCATSAWAAPPDTPACPPPLEFSARKAELLEELRQTRSSSAGKFLTRHLVALYVTAPNRKAQEMLNNGILMRQIEDNDGAGRAFDKLIAYCPGFAEGYHQRALVRRSQGDIEGALADLDAALRHAPDHIGAMARKAQVLSQMGRIADAQALQRAVLALNPWMPARFTELDLPGVAL